MIRKSARVIASAALSLVGSSGLVLPGRADTSAAPAVPAPPVAASEAAKAVAPLPETGLPAGQYAAPAKAPAASADKGWTLFGSLRVRVEDQNFFPTPKANGAYTYAAETLRFGVMRQMSQVDYLLEMEAPGLFNLPTKAVAAAPQGQLGHGATYFAVNKSRVANLFLKQGYVRLKFPGTTSNSLKLGRFEFSDGQETVSPDPALNWIKQNRIGQRLLGPFGYTMVTRSFDGLQFVSNTPKLNVTALGVFPTRGAFDLNGWDSLADIRVIYLAATVPHARKTSASDARLFFMYYEDARSKVVKTDNRPAAARATDHSAIRIQTYGGHYARVMNAGAGKADVMVWGAGQVGKWGVQEHGAFAVAAEAGYQLPNTAWKPWLRFGYHLASGDGNPNNNQHGTFFPVLPTARVYARYPFFGDTNLQDIFGQLIVKPCTRLTMRGDVHALRLADSHDLWYSGGGAFNNSVFGYSGRPSGGRGELATLVDLSADYQISKSTTVTLYGAYANGGGAVANNFTSRDSIFGFAEVNWKF